MVTFPLSPLMHGGAQAAMLMHLFAGHLTLLPRIRPRRGVAAVDAHQVQLIFMTGDAMARPLIEAYDRARLRRLLAGGGRQQRGDLQPPVKERWMAAFPNTFFTDSVGSSETGFQGTGLQDAENIKGEGCVVALGPQSVVLGEDNASSTRPPTSGRSAGWPAAATSRSATTRTRRSPRRTFIEIDGRRYSVPGDFARIEADNKVTLLGRGSNCINTGGEKVYPEEVEMALKAHPDVYDVLVVGVPDENYGQAVAPSSSRARAPPELEELRTLPARRRSPATSCPAR